MVQLSNTKKTYSDSGSRTDALRLLVVDEADVCEFVKGFFGERNFEVSVARDGKEILSAVEAGRPDIVLLDIKLPGMDGAEVLKEIRKNNEAIKVIIITAVENEKKAEEAKHHGAIEYITKPLLLEQLERTVFTAAEQIRMGN
ncbi:MAG: response regulator [Candidatus Omnitrophota bacterium]